jgi:hypothetical protein
LNEDNVDDIEDSVGDYDVDEDDNVDCYVLMYRVLF